MNTREPDQNLPTPTTRITALLESIYGGASAGDVAREVGRLLDEFRPRLPRAGESRGALPLTERDALLITYGDMVRQEGQAPLRTLAEFCGQHLCDVLSGVHLLPHFPYTSDDGFSVTDYFAVDPALGAWEDVERLGRSFDLMFDAVFNHMSAQGEWFRQFLADAPARRDFFVTVEGNPDLSRVVRPRALPLLTEFQGSGGARRVWTTFSADQADLNFKNPAVLIETLRALLFYVEKGARFIRLDAIAYLWKETSTPCIHLPQTHGIIQFWRAVLDKVAPHVLLITETNVPHADNISYFGDGTNEAQLVYNFALPPLVLHALLRGDATHLARWAQSLTPPGNGVTFFNFLASHDGIGLNPARGILPGSEINFLVERCLAHGGFINYKHDTGGSMSPYEMNIVYFDAVNDPAAGESAGTQAGRFLVSQAIMLALRGLPAIYFHSLFGSRNDRAAALASGINRRINRQKFPRAELESEMAKKDSIRALTFGRYREMLRARRATPAFHPTGGQRIPSCDSRVFAVLRTSPDGLDQALCLHNLSADTVVASVSGDEFRHGETWTNILTGDPHHVRQGASLTVALPPFDVCWLNSRSDSTATSNP